MDNSNSAAHGDPHHQHNEPTPTAPLGWSDLRFAVAWLLPLLMAWAAWQSPWWAFTAGLGIQVAIALAERLPQFAHSPPARDTHPWFDAVLRVHAVLQLALLALGVMVARAHWPEAGGTLAVWALGIGVGNVTGSLGITFSHELGHSRSRLNRATGWLLMASVMYAHFMVEHYRGHHVRVATDADPASSRQGESLWRFLPRTLWGSWRSAWQLEAQQLARLRKSWWHSTLLWVSLGQVGFLVLLTAIFGAGALVFWLVQSAQAVFLLETVNYIEHYGLRRRAVQGRPEPFAMHHAWNADHGVTNSFLANLQRHSDHHMHAWKPYPSLEPLPGPQLPTGYAGCLFLACVPPLWFRVMDKRLAASQHAPSAAAP